MNLSRYEPYDDCKESKCMSITISLANGGRNPNDPLQPASVKSTTCNLVHSHNQSSTSTASVSQSLAYAYGSINAHQQSSQNTNTFFKRCSPELMQVGGSVDSYKEGAEVTRER